MAGLKYLKIGKTFLASLSMPIGTSEFTGPVADIAPKLKKSIKKKRIMIKTNKSGEVFGMLDPKNLT